MAHTKILTFNGLAPLISPKLLDPTMAQVAENVKLDSGRIEAFNTAEWQADAGANTKTIFLWHRNVDSWLMFNDDVNVALSPIADDDKYRLYLTGDSTRSSIPAVKGWTGGAEVTRDIKMATPATITGITTADRSELTTFLAGLAVTWEGTIDLRYTITDSSFVDTESSDSIPTPITASLYAVRDTATGSYTINAVFNPWSFTYSGPAGNTINTFSVKYTGDFVVNYNGAPISSGAVASLGALGTMTLAFDFKLPKILFNFDGRFLVTGPTFSNAITAIPNFILGPNQWQQAVYVQTYVDDWGQEGPQSEPSAAVAWVPGQQINLTFAALPGGNVVKRRVYRNNPSAGTTTYYLVNEGTGTTLTDTAADDVIVLNAECPLVENPPDDLVGIINMAGQMMAGFVGKDVYFSDPLVPNSWRTEWRVTMDDDIVGLGFNSNILYVFTKGISQCAEGTHPSLMSFRKMEVESPCASKRSIANVGQYVCYASNHGIMGAYGAKITNLTVKEHYDPLQFEALDPEHTFAAAYAEQYYLFRNTMTPQFLIFDPRAGKNALVYGKYGQNVGQAAYTDVRTDTLYFVQSEDIYAWDAGSFLLAWEWQSKNFEYIGAIDPTCGRLELSGGNGIVELKLYANDIAVLPSQVLVTNNKGFRLPRLRPERVWSYKLIGDSTIDLLHISQSMKELH